MLTVRGKQVVEMSAGQLDRLAAGYGRTVVDVGTGDGRFAYAYAKERPRDLVIGLDATADNLTEISRRALRKRGKGGLDNVLFVWASVERPPDELAGRADELHVVLPWGKLMVGLLLAHDDVLGGLVRLARPGATLRVVLNAEVWGDPVPREAQELPELTLERVSRELAPAYAVHGVQVHEARWLSPEEIDALPSTWAKRLAHGRDRPRFLAVDAGIAPVAGAVHASDGG